mgnify:CR=1 FL=1
MRLDVLDADTLVRVGWVDVWVSLYWDSPYYSEGGFTLEVRPTTENLQLLTEGRWAATRRPASRCGSAPAPTKMGTRTSW